VVILLCPNAGVYYLAAFDPPGAGGRLVLLETDSKSSSVYLSELSLISFVGLALEAGFEAGGAPPFFSAYFARYSSMALALKTSLSPSAASFDYEALKLPSIASLPGQY